MKELNEAQAQVVKDVAATGAAIAYLRPILGQALFPLPFRLPDPSSWEAAQPVSSEADDIRSLNRAGASDGAFDEEATDGDAEQGSASKPIVAGAVMDTGILRATCAFLLHGDPRTQKLTSQALNWAAKQTSNGDRR